MSSIKEEAEIGWMRGGGEFIKKILYNVVEEVYLFYIVYITSFDCREVMEK